ncbi:uncharacterized protein LOC135848952 isoform X3 [Planococcus citri]|uniref:uncharacterized protein LOC135848952 isoform X3 n=1 Tax=Planococcus citri TaxID=170843 RepID=UPI0031F9994A
MATVGIDLENKDTYSPPFPRLEGMAALATALNVWNYYFSHHEWKYCEHELKKVNEISNDMKVPNCIRKKITALCETIKNQMSEYSTDLMRRMCHTDGSRYHFFQHGAVWGINGHINEKKTAEKVLQCPERSNDNDHMFKMITAHCLENHINDFPMSSLREKFYRNSYVYDSRRELTDYWIEYKRSEENASDGGYDGRFQNQRRRILDQIKVGVARDWAMCAYEYFWDFLDENEQVTMARNLIHVIQSDKKFQMFLFSKMNRDQLRCLYSEMSVDIIVNYFGIGELELAIATWERVRLTIREVEFELLIDNILWSEMYQEDNNIECLINLWSSAPDNLIDYMINVKNCAITGYFFRGMPESRLSCSSFDFLKVILLRTTLNFRKQLFLEKASHLLLFYPHVLFRSLIEDCLDVSDQLEITEILLVTAMESEQTKILCCFRDLLYCSVEEFNAFLKFLTLDPDLQMRVKKRLLRSGLLITRKLIRIDNWAKLSQFIDDLYPNNEKEARRQKKKASNSFLRSHFHYWSCFRRNGDQKFSEIDNLFAQFFTPEEIVTFKENIIEQFQIACSDTEWNSDVVVKRVDIPKLTAWCYNGDEEKISQFKRSFPIDTAFQLFLREAVERYVNKRDADLSFSSLDHLLGWKFASKKCIKSFKKSQIHGVMKIRNVRANYLCKGWKIYLSDVLKRIIAWIFDGNEFQIEQFKRLYQDEDKLKIIYWLKVKEDSVRRDIKYYHSSDESD